MQQCIDDFLSSLREEKGYSNNTIVAYRNDLGQFEQFLRGERHRGLVGGQKATPGAVCTLSRIAVRLAAGPQGGRDQVLFPLPRTRHRAG